MASLIVRKSSSLSPSELEDADVDAYARLIGDITYTKSVEITVKN